MSDVPLSESEVSSELREPTTSTHVSMVAVSVDRFSTVPWIEMDCSGICQYDLATADIQLSSPSKKSRSTPPTVSLFPLCQLCRKQREEPDTHSPR